MCTAITFQRHDHYFGRNLDLEYRFHEAVVITPRNYVFNFRCENPISSHYAMIGMATVENDYPLYYEATNEYGLSVAGLNFPGNAKYFPPAENARNIAPFELIPWILSQCKSVSEAKHLLYEANIADIPFNEKYPLTPLHWIIADATGAITVEQLANGLNIHDNTIGILTNNPTFDFHMNNLINHLNITAAEPNNRFSNDLTLLPYSRGMGGIGLPGDLSSSSRFVKAAFVKLNSVCGSTESESVSQFFHILNSVAQQRGCVHVNGKYEMTLYSSCCNTSKGIYYYTTYENSQISAVRMHAIDLTTDQLYKYPLVTKTNINWIN